MYLCPMARRIVVATRQWVRNHTDEASAGLLALATLVPMLFTSRGEVSADTKSYLTLDPGRMLSSARFMWDP